jgi:hypothetical protein
MEQLNVGVYSQEQSAQAKNEDWDMVEASETVGEGWVMESEGMEAPGPRPRPMMEERRFQ